MRGDEPLVTIWATAHDDRLGVPRMRGDEPLRILTMMIVTFLRVPRMRGDEPVHPLNVSAYRPKSSSPHARG